MYTSWIILIAVYYIFSVILCIWWGLRELGDKFNSHWLSLSLFGAPVLLPVLLMVECLDTLAVFLRELYKEECSLKKRK